MYTTIWTIFGFVYELIKLSPITIKWEKVVEKAVTRAIPTPQLHSSYG